MSGVSGVSGACEQDGSVKMPWCLGCLLQNLWRSSVELQRFRAVSQSPFASASQEKVPEEGGQPKLQ